MRIYNTLSRKVEDFEPINPPNVGMYTCGPTVYWSTHIGHMSKYVGDDILRRVLTYNGYKVKHVMNITDVGHLTSDADSGEDKMEKGAQREGLSVWELAKKYEEEFFETMDALNVLRPNVLARATEHIADQIDLIKRLTVKGFTYETDSAVYFDVDKFPTYGKLSSQKLEEKVTGAREEVVVDSQKRHPYDFALWFKTVGRFQNHIMHWDSPWGDGFPGWHIECSAMSMKYLGESFDIHTGGIDHLGVHHPAEIAQSEAATGKPFVKYWVHRVFIQVSGKKMSKSLGNFYTSEDVRKNGFDPLALRYLFLTSHYRQAMNFTWEALTGAQSAYRKLKKDFKEWNESIRGVSIPLQYTNRGEGFKERFKVAISDDLNTAGGLAILWEVAKSDLFPGEKRNLVLEFEKVLGLGLEEGAGTEIRVPEEVRVLVDGREELRRERKWTEADVLRVKIEKLGWMVEDTEKGPKARKL